MDATTICERINCSRWGSNVTIDTNGCCVEKKAPCTSPIIYQKKDETGKVIGGLRGGCPIPVIFGCPVRSAYGYGSQSVRS
jgi:hypothetical protein